MKILVLLSSVVGLGAAVGILAVVLQSPGERTDHLSSPAPRSPSPEQIAADRVAQCEAIHRLDAQTQKTTESDSVVAFASCTWPPLPYSDSDGYTEITVEKISRPDGSEFSGDSMVDRITGPCRVFSLSYDFGFQGDLERRPAFAVPAGLITSLDPPGAPWPPGTAALDFYPERNEVDVVHNTRNAISHAACDS
ncbi:hypothetical protein [Saccharopolyspora taberi]|uniref:DUF3558 domain-containing protein n=1 Tax=Saccharopolyspora taberi TaxID=60895 RepID=A0ABN3V3V9_9PSEU